MMVAKTLLLLASLPLLVAVFAAIGVVAALVGLAQAATEVWS